MSARLAHEQRVSWLYGFKLKKTVQLIKNLQVRADEPS